MRVILVINIKFAILNAIERIFLVNCLWIQKFWIVNNANTEDFIVNYRLSIMIDHFPRI